MSTARHDAYWRDEIQVTSYCVFCARPVPDGSPICDSCYWLDDKEN